MELYCLVHNQKECNGCLTLAGIFVLLKDNTKEQSQQYFISFFCENNMWILYHAVISTKAVDSGWNSPWADFVKSISESVGCTSKQLCQAAKILIGLLGSYNENSIFWVSIWTYGLLVELCHYIHFWLLPHSLLHDGSCLGGWAWNGW